MIKNRNVFEWLRDINATFVFIFIIQWIRNPMLLGGLFMKPILIFGLGVVFVEVLVRTVVMFTDIALLFIPRETAEKIIERLKKDG